LDSQKDLSSLSEEIQSAINHMMDCKRICEKVDEALSALQTTESAQLEAAQNPTQYPQKEQKIIKVTPRSFTEPTVKASRPNSVHLPPPKAPKALSNRSSKPVLVGLGLPPRPRRISVSQTYSKDHYTSNVQAGRPLTSRKRSVHWGPDVRDTYEPEDTSSI
jgi:hypothetical protein